MFAVNFIDETNKKRILIRNQKDGQLAIFSTYECAQTFEKKLVSEINDLLTPKYKFNWFGIGKKEMIETLTQSQIRMYHRMIETIAIEKVASIKYGKIR